MDKTPFHNDNNQATNQSNARKTNKNNNNTKKNRTIVCGFRVRPWSFLDNNSTLFSGVVPWGPFVAFETAISSAPVARRVHPPRSFRTCQDQQQQQQDGSKCASEIQPNYYTERERESLPDDIDKPMEPKKQPNECTCNWNKWPHPCTDNLWIGHETIHCVIVVVVVCPHCHDHL